MAKTYQVLPFIEVVAPKEVLAIWIQKGFPV